MSSLDAAPTSELVVKLTHRVIDLRFESSSEPKEQLG
jgi:hypothetical protein